MRRCLGCGCSLDQTYRQRRRCKICARLEKYRLERARVARRRVDGVWERPRVQDDLTREEIEYRYQEALAAVKRERPFTVDPWAQRGDAEPFGPEGA